MLEVYFLFPFDENYLHEKYLANIKTRIVIELEPTEGSSAETPDAKPEGEKKEKEEEEDLEFYYGDERIPFKVHIPREARPDEVQMDDAVSCVIMFISGTYHNYM